MRHGEKQYDNKTSHDSPLHDYAHITLDQSAHRLKQIENIENFDIVVSPFLRCRQTYDILKKHIDLKHPTFRTQIQEYLGHQKKKGNAILDETTKSITGEITLGEENLTQLEERCISFHKNLQQNTLIITHSFCASIIHKYVKGEHFKLNEGEFVILDYE